MNEWEEAVQRDAAVTSLNVISAAGKLKHRPTMRRKNICTSACNSVHFSMTSVMRQWCTVLLLIVYPYIGSVAHIPFDDAPDDYSTVQRFGGETKASSMSARPIWTKTKHVPVLTPERLPLVHHADEDLSIIQQLHESLPIFDEHPLSSLLDRQPCKPRDPPLV